MPNRHRHYEGYLLQIVLMKSASMGFDSQELRKSV
jgi:hypothetical protein